MSVEHDTPDGQPEFPFSREFRVYGWKRILEHMEDGELKDTIRDEIADPSYKETTGIELALHQHEAEAIDKIAKDHQIDPHHIPDMGENIRGKGKNHKDE